jgi:hypothetical protein
MTPMTTPPTIAVSATPTIVGINQAGRVPLLGRDGGGSQGAFREAPQSAQNSAPAGRGAPHAWHWSTRSESDRSDIAGLPAARGQGVLTAS